MRERRYIMKKLDVLELKKRKWPTPPFLVDPEIRNPGLRFKTYSNLPKPGNYEISFRVKEGKVIAYPLYEKGRKSAIPPGESAITSLTLGNDGKVYGATSGRMSHLFVYNPKATDAGVRDLGIIGESCQVTKSLVVSSKGFIFGGTRGENGRIFAYDTKSANCEIKTVTIPEKKEGIGQLVIDKHSDTIYGVTVPSGTFFVFYIKSGKIEFKQRIDEAGIFSEALIVTPDGSVFGGGRWGQLFIYRRGDSQLKYLNIKIPYMPGREIYTKIDVFAVDEKNGCIYGGENADGLVFKLNPNTMEITCLGKPLSQPRIRCMTVGKDGCVYGVGGRQNGMCQLFRYNPQKGELKNLGVLYTNKQRYWHAYEFECALTGPNGEIYLGESDRISHLFVYLPAE
jgi:hypothetical protein